MAAAGLVICCLASGAAPSQGKAEARRTAGAKTPTTGTLKLVTTPKQPVIISLARASARALVGSLTLLIKNDSAVNGRLRIRFFVSKTGVFSDLVAGRPDSPPRDRPAIYDQTPNLAIGAKQTRLVQLRLATAPDASADLVNGLLVVTLKPTKPAVVKPITLETVGQFETGPTPSTEVPQPSNVSMVVTSALPFGHWYLWGEHQQVLIPAAPDEAIDRAPTFMLGSDSGGLVRATLSVRAKDEATKNGMTPGVIVVDKVGRSDRYSGDLTLGPSTNDKLALTVHVRDFFLWPFLALAAGAFLGGFGTMWWEQRRRRALLVKRAKDAYNTYEAFTRNRPPDRPPPPLDPDAQTQLDALVNAIGKTNTDDDYDTQVDEVAANEDNLRVWLRRARAADLLIDHQVNPGAEPLATDVERMIAWLAVQPDDQQERSQLADQAETLAEVLPRLGFQGVVNPAKAFDPYVPDLVVEGKLADLKCQRTPFFRAADLYGIDPQFAVTFNHKDLERYRETYPSIDLFFWIDWHEIWREIGGVRYEVEAMAGVWRASFPAVRHSIESDSVRSHSYLHRLLDDAGNGRQSYVFDVRRFEFLGGSDVARDQRTWSEENRVTA